MWSLVLGILPKLVPEKARPYVLLALGVIVAMLGIYLWHHFTLTAAVSEAEDAKDKEWTTRLTQGIDSVKKSVTITEKPSKPLDHEITGSHIDADSIAGARIDSARQVWTLSQADKDSLLEYYLQPRTFHDTASYQVVDSSFEESDGVRSLKVTIRNYRLPVKIGIDPLQDLAKLHLEMPPIFIRTEKIDHTRYVPLPEKWYESGTVQFTAGVVVGAGVIYGIIQAVKNK